MQARRRLCGGVALLVCLVAAGPAIGASDARLSVKKVDSPPAEAAPGDSFKVSGKVVNKGDRNGRAQLTAELRGGGVSYRLGKSRTNVGAGESKRFEFDVKVPSRVETSDELKLVACVRRHGDSGARRCRKARDRMKVIAPPVPPREYVAGSRSLGDPLLPQIGNGGYDVKHYRIYLDYDPVANRFDSAKTTIDGDGDAEAEGVQPRLPGPRRLRGERRRPPADFEQVDATPDLSADPERHPADEAGRRRRIPRRGRRRAREFTVKVTYSGRPRPITDADTSIEGWIRACYPLDPPQTCDGAFVVNEPIGRPELVPVEQLPDRQGDLRHADPRARRARPRSASARTSATPTNGDGTVTWHWREDDPTATYLTTATVGDFNYTVDSMTETSTGRTLPVYNAVDSSATPAQADGDPGRRSTSVPARSTTSATRTGPTRSTRPARSPTARPASATRSRCRASRTTRAASPSATRRSTSAPSSTSSPTSGSATASRSQTWADIWFNEGWANWSEWYWEFQTQGGDDPAVIFDDLYANTPTEDWEIAPAILDGDPANLFAFFPTYQRGAMTVEGYREIVGDATFFALANDLIDEYALRQHQHRRSSSPRRSRPAAHGREARPARRLLPAVALRRDEADDPAGGLRPVALSAHPAKRNSSEAGASD